MRALGGLGIGFCSVDIAIDDRPRENSTRRERCIVGSGSCRHCISDIAIDDAIGLPSNRKILGRGVVLPVESERLRLNDALGRIATRQCNDDGALGSFVER